MSMGLVAGRRWRRPPSGAAPRRAVAIVARAAVRSSAKERGTRARPCAAAAIETAAARSAATSHCSIVGRRWSSARALPVAVARHSAAAMAMRSLIPRARASSTPRKIPGKHRELLIWLGKSLRPVPTIRAPASFASQGHISGTGLAQARMIESPAMAATAAGEMMPGAAKATRASAPRRASSMPPVMLSALLSVQTRHLSAKLPRRASMSPRPRWSVPLLSQATIPPGSMP